jgi:hypothetical protein
VSRDVQREVAGMREPRSSSPQRRRPPAGPHPAIQYRGRRHPATVDPS